MAANKLNKDENNNTSSEINGLKGICIKYKKFIAAGAMLVLLAVVIAGSRVTASKSGTPGSNNGSGTINGSGTEREEFEIDAYPEVNTLFSDYYKYYAAGDTEALEKIAYPVSSTEKSYIKLFSGYIESYEGIKCYTTQGIADGEFIALVASDMKFKNIDTVAPELGCFYVRKDESGAYYIDNAYSQFNQSNEENSKDEKIDARIAELLEQDEEVIALQKQVQKDYEKALSSDADLDTMLKTTVQNAMSEWVSSFSTKTDDDEKDGDQSSDAQDDGRAAYTSTKVNMRAKRNINSDVVRTLKEGKKVTVYGESQKGWLKVKVDDDTGFIKDEYIVAEKPGSEEKDNDTSNENNENENNENENNENETVEKRTAYAKTKVNLRERRSTNSDVIRVLKAGTEVTVYGESKKGFYKVKVAGDTGFVSDEYIVSDKSEVEQEKDKSEKRTAYAKTTVNLRQRRNTNSKVLKTLKPGTKVTVYGKSKKGWYKIKAKGKTGFVKDDYIVSDKSKVEKEDNNDQQDNSNSSSPSYYNEGDRITLSDSVNVRKSMSENADRVGLAFKGDVVTVIMSYSEGWTKVTWNGETGYIKTEYLK